MAWFKKSQIGPVMSIHSLITEVLNHIALQNQKG